MAASEEKTEIIPVTLPLEVWGVLALQADAKDMTLNDYMIFLAMQEATRVEGMVMCADHWLKYDSEWVNTIMIDPDGWDRTGLENSWAELITRDEMVKRMWVSTSLTNKKV